MWRIKLAALMLALAYTSPAQAVSCQTSVIASVSMIYNGLTRQPISVTVPVFQFKCTEAVSGNIRFTDYPTPNPDYVVNSSGTLALPYSKYFISANEPVDIFYFGLQEPGATKTVSVRMTMQGGLDARPGVYRDIVKIDFRTHQ